MPASQNIAAPVMVHKFALGSAKGLDWTRGFLVPGYVKVSLGWSRVHAFARSPKENPAARDIRSTRPRPLSFSAQFLEPIETDGPGYP